MDNKSDGPGPETPRIVRIAPNQCIALRQAVLRPGQDRSECVYPGDDDAASFHLGSFADGNLVCIASFYQEASPEIDTQHFSKAGQYRLRGMATDPSYQKQGLGASVLGWGEQELLARGGELLWCNARVSALGFYEKLGYRKCSMEFEIPGIGPHFRMMKVLDG